MDREFKPLAGKSNGLRTIMFFMGLIFLFATISQAAEDPSRVLRMGLMGEIDPLNPNDVGGSTQWDVARSIFEKLVTADQSMNILPVLATSWEITPEGDLIFNLRKGVTFHDGTPLTSEAVKMTFDRMRDQKLGMWRYFRSGMKSIEIIDDYKVKMDVNGSPHALLSVLASYGWIESPTAIRKYSNKEFGLHPVGTGPFKYVEWVPHQRVVLEANEAYWGGEPKLSKIIFVPVPDPQTRLAMLEAGDLDVLNRAPVTEIERLEADPNIVVQSTASGSMVNFAFNCVRKPFDDKRVRQAIAYAIDLKAIVNTLLFGQVLFAETYAAPNIKYIVKYDIYPYNPEKAKSMLAELGWKRGKSGYLEKDGEVFRTALLQPSGRYPMDRQIGEAVQAQLKKVGIDLKIMILESASFIKALYLKREEKMKAEYGIMMASRPMGPDADSAFNSNFHSTSPRNKALYVNKDLDVLLEAGAKEIDEAKRAAIYKQVQDILYEDLPWIPIYSYVNNVVVRKGVKNVGSPSPFISFQIGADAQKVP